MTEPGLNAQRKSQKLSVIRIHKRLADHRRLIAFAIYGAVTLFAYSSAFMLRFEFAIPELYRDVLLSTALVLLAIRLVAFHVFRLARGRWRYVSTTDIGRLVLSVLAGSVAFGLVDAVVLAGRRVPASVILMEAVLTCFMIAGVWIAYRLAFESFKRRGRDGSPKRVIVIGAGEAGNLLVREMLRLHTRYQPVGFVDDDPSMWGASLHGVEVLGSTQDLKEIAETYHVDELIIAIPSATPAALREVVLACEKTGLPYKVLPGIAAVFAGNVALNQLRDVRIEDLLGREPVDLRLPELAADLANTVVLITGAAGSIGSELSRQVALHAPRVLLILDQAETPLFFLDMELREAHPDLTIVPIVCDVTDAAALESVFAQHRPDRVFHAAAYKHVPLMESNQREAVRNNVIGTWRVADAAGRHGVERFVLVSTDKAVRPANIMGATKRLAEIITLELQEQYPDTAYGAVRFGNVLGSAGSVIDVFKRQIEKGQPLTVTHPDMTRFFMTIPEAVQLILQSSLLTDFRGHIAMLEMGDPVRIVDLAANLLRLSGHAGAPSERIVFTGVRPGEKMHEELLAPDEEKIPTPLDKITVLSTSRFRTYNVLRRMNEWSALLDEKMGDRVLEEIRTLFPMLDRDYQEPEVLEARPAADAIAAPVAPQEWKVAR